MVSIDMDYFLAEVLRTRPHVSFVQLNDLATRVMRSLHVHVNLTSDSLNDALRHYPELFTRGNHYVARAERARNYFVQEYIDAEFSQIPADIRSQMRTLVSGEAYCA